MYVDALAQFSDGQAVTAAAASDNSIDLGVTRRDIGNSDLFLVVNCTVAMTDSSSDSTLAVILQQDGDTAFGSASTAITVGTFPATSAVGTRFIKRLSPTDITERYLRVYYTPASGNLSTGSFDAFLTTNVDNFRAYPDNVTIS